MHDDAMLLFVEQCGALSRLTGVEEGAVPSVDGKEKLGCDQDKVVKF